MKNALIISILALLPFFAAGQNATLADMQQDFALLKREVGGLRGEVEQLRRENAALQEKLNRLTSSSAGNEAVQAQVNAAKAEMRAHNEAMKRDVLATVKKEMESMAEQTNANMKKLADAIDVRPTAAIQPTFSEDYPKTGITYTVKGGDTLSKLAKEYSSRIKWIQSANRIADANRDLRVGEEIFIPQQQ